MKKVLVFKNSGWCKELNNSYEKGRHEPRTEKEFNALKKYASEVIEIKPFKKSETHSDETTETTEIIEKQDDSIVDSDGNSNVETVEFTEERIAELRSQAKEAGINNWHSKKPENLVKELGLEK